MRLVKEFLMHTQYVDLVVCGELIFFTVFVLAVAWIFRKGSKDFYERLAALPLETKGGSHE